jgi:hypothetical protein
MLPVSHSRDAVHRSISFAETRKRLYADNKRPRKPGASNFSPTLVAAAFGSCLRRRRRCGSGERRLGPGLPEAGEAEAGEPHRHHRIGRRLRNARRVQVLV